jgi:uncharacterized protein (TIGR02118 family)
VRKGLVFFKRRSGVDLTDFRAWATACATKLAGQPGVTGGVLHLTHDTGYRAHEPDYDALVELTLDGETFPLPDDDGSMADPSFRGTVLADEVVIVDGPVPAGGITLFAFLTRRPDVEPAAFRAYWRDRHGPLAGTVPGIRRYVQNHAVAGDYDGVAQTWLDDMEAVQASGTSEELARTRADEPNFMVSGRLPFILCTSDVVP